MKDSNHYENHMNLYDYIYSKYKSYSILDKNSFYIDDIYYKDKVYIKKSFKYPLTESERNKIKTIVKITKMSDYKNNDKVGVVEIYLGKDLIGSRDIFVRCSKQKRKESFFSKIFKN